MTPDPKLVGTSAGRCKPEQLGGDLLLPILISPGQHLILLRFEIQQPTMGARHQAQIGLTTTTRIAEALCGSAHGTAEFRFI